MTHESYVVQISVRHGERAAQRRKLHVPWHCAVGEYEELSDRALNDLIKDLWHEQRRREGLPLEQPARRWDPYATQLTFIPIEEDE